MKGCIPLTDAQIESIKDHLNLRDHALFVLGLKTGYRISELLSIKVKDVYRDGMITDELTVARKYMKGKKEGRTLPLGDEVKDILLLLIQMTDLKPDDFLFRSDRQNKAISRIQAWRTFKDAVKQAGIQGKVASHSMRKTFAKKVFKLLKGDLMHTQKALGHKSINSTICYLATSDEVVIDAILKV